MGSVERELERAVESIRHGFFDVANLKGIRFLDFSKKIASIFNLDTHQAKITLSIFNFSIIVSDIHTCLPFKSLSILCSFRLL